MLRTGFSKKGLAASELAIIILSILAHNLLLAFLLALGGVLMAVYAGKDSPIIHIEVTQKGIRVDDAIYPYKNIKKSDVHGIIHCSGGGQTKVLKFINKNVRVVKDNLFPIPPLFTEIQKTLNTPWEQMYKNFNMGHRMEIYCSLEVATVIKTIARKFNIDAKVVGWCDFMGSHKNQLRIESEYGGFDY